MSSRSTSLIARRSIRSRLGRTIVIAFAIAAGVAFVVGTFVLADSMKASFHGLVEDTTDDLDLQVRTVEAFDTGNQELSQRDPLSSDVVESVRDVEGIEVAVPQLERAAQVIETNDAGERDVVGDFGLAMSWTEGSEQFQALNFRDGSPPAAAGEVALDQATADDMDVGVGDEIEVATAAGSDTYTVSGLVGLGDTDGFAGASVVIFQLDEAMAAYNTDGMVDYIDIQVSEGADLDEVQARIDNAVPDNVEVVTGEEITEEASDEIDGFINALANGLLGFAFVTAFVSAFIINNVFAITIGQRLRELALLRAIGAAGRQVRRMITVEAIGVSAIATVLGIGLGIGVARLLVAFFQALGGGFPDVGTVVEPRTIVMAFVVGVGVTLASVLIPARRAAKIPPVAAMHPEVGYTTINTRRLAMSIVVTTVGAIVFLVGLFVQPGGNWQSVAILGGLGAILIFLGIAGVSSTVARPAVNVLGYPIAKLFGTPGRLARDNAARSPRRTSSTAAALMIGVALVSAAAVFGASLRDTLNSIMDRGVQADYIITPESFAGGVPEVARAELDNIPELGTVSSLKSAQFEIGDKTPAINAGDPAALPELMELDLQESDWSDLNEGDIFLHEDLAEDLEVGVGDTIEATAVNGSTHPWDVTGIYADAALVTNGVVSPETIEATAAEPPDDFMVLASLAGSIDAGDDAAVAEADEAIRAAMADLPQAKVQTRGEFLQQVEDDINMLLSVISGLLFFAIIIAVLGISITLALAVFERTREIGLLRAVGMNRRQTRRSVRWEAVLVSLFGAVVGIVVGSLIGVAISLALPEEFVNTVSFSPAITVTILVGALIAGLVAALYPSYKASKMDVLDAISTE